VRSRCNKNIESEERALPVVFSKMNGRFLSGKASAVDSASSGSGKELCSVGLAGN
jgi:hypothetical protein